MNEFAEIPRARFAQRASLALDKAEAIYLRVLRAAILIIATLLLVYAGWLALSSLYKLTRSTDSVVEQVAAVQADEITNAEMPAEKKASQLKAKGAANPEHRTFYQKFAQHYYNLYRTKFEPFRQQEDKQLAVGEFDDSFLNTKGRLEAIKDGDLDFASDKADLERLLVVMTESADRPVTKDRLAKYRSAKKIPVQRQVERTRTEYQRGWNSYSTDCAYWYESPVGCSETRPVEVPYTETVTEMQYPDGTQSHTQIFRAFQDRYFQLLDRRRQENSAKAEAERQGILDGHVTGELSLMTALQLVGAFLVLMFFFLLIAIERHQRRVSEREAIQEQLS